MTPEERRAVMEELISEIQIYDDRQSNGQWLKSIVFKLPILSEPIDIGLDNGTHMECVISLSQQYPDDHIEFSLDLDEMDATPAETKATYKEIKDYVKEQTGLNVTPLYIAQIKQKCGIIERECYNKPKSESYKQPQCPPEKEKAIREALKHFQMI